MTSINKSFTIKVQTPVVSNDDAPPALIYDQTRSVELFVPFQEVKDLMAGSYKKFFKAHFDKEENLIIEKEVGDPGW